MSAHTATAYFKPHHKSRLAFIEECVLIWCDDRTRFVDDSENMAAVEASIRKDVMARLGPEKAEHVDHFVSVELSAFRNELDALDLRHVLNQIDKPRPKKGNLRRHIPKHLPLRPNRAIIATCARILRAGETISTNALYDRVAEHFSDGIPRSEAGDRLTNRNVRSACESFGAFDSNEVMMRNYRRALRRFRTAGSPHVWDWNFYDAMVWGQAYEHSLGRSANKLTSQMTYLLRDLPLAALERLYREARASAAFSGLFGVDLARALDARLGLRKLVSDRMNTLAPLLEGEGGRTANAAA